jgi:hypothetical protein
MKIKVGDILRSRYRMTITIDKGDKSDEEHVGEGEYFVVIEYGEYKEDRTCVVGWTLLSQKRMTVSKWDEEHCILEESFTKV